MTWRQVWHLITLASMLFASPLFADPVSFYQSFAGYINFQMTGASLRSQPNGGGTAACQVNGSADADLISIPAGATIQSAYLYWAGSGSTADNQVTFQGVTINASRTFSETFNYNGTDYDFFSGFADVTALVTGNGTYTLSDLTVHTGSPHCGVSAVLSGWSLMVIYAHPGEPLRVINLYDGFRYFQNSQITLNPSNFQIPPGGCVAAGDCKWGILTWEGDPNLASSGENLYFNNMATPITSGVNPAGNQFNSTIDLLGTMPTPPGASIYGVDVDVYSVQGNLSAGDTSATTRYQAGQDLVLLSAEVISVLNTPVADLSISKSHPRDFFVGRQETYAIRVTNNGPLDDTGPITVTDALPAGLTYVSGSGAGWSCTAVGQDVTCTHPGPLANGANLPDLILTMDVDAAAVPSVTNTAAVSSPMFDNQAANDSTSDVTTVFDTSPASGTKLLYFYMDQAPAPDTNTLQRVVNTSNTRSNIFAPGNSYVALLTPAIQAPLTLEAGSISVPLWLRRRNGGTDCDVTVTLDYFGGSTGTLGSHTRNNILGPSPWQYLTFTINLAAPVTLNPNTTLRFTLTNEATSSGNLRAMTLRAGRRSQIELNASTVINVDSVDAYTDVAFPGGVIQSSYQPNRNIRIRAVVSDPFGHDDITSAAITILDPAGNPVVTDAGMTEVAPLAPGTPGALKIYEHPFSIPAGPYGNWTVRVTADEGSEGTISHSGIGFFLVGIPSISVTKIVTTVSNPFEGTLNPKAIPGAIMEYQVVVTNTGIGPADADSVLMSDPLPPNLRLVLNSPIAPVTFIDNSSGLAFDPLDIGNNALPPYNDLALSNDDGTNFLPLGAISETGGIDSTVPKINYLRINPKGVFQGFTGAGSPPAFTLIFRAQVE